MDKQKSATKNFVFCTQFGIQTLLPLMGLILLSLWVQDTFLLGEWVMIVAIIVGVLYIPYSFYALYVRYTKQQEKEEKLKQFNKHI